MVRKQAKAGSSEGCEDVADEDKDARLSSLEERLRKARGDDPADSHGDGAAPDGSRSNALGIAFRIGVDLVVGAIVGAIIGYAIDGWLETKPLFLIVFLILGFAAGIRNVLREAIKLQGPDDGHA